MKPKAWEALSVVFGASVWFEVRSKECAARPFALTVVAFDAA
jgi:hypothetical protein